jgi:O-antigen/teichoic acid export membrane protein
MSIKINAIANFAGQGWSAILGLIVVPIYLRVLGVETYGILAFLMSLQTVLAVLDFGLGATATREVARLISDEERLGELPVVISVFLSTYIIIALVVGAALFLAADEVARAFLKTTTLNLDQKADLIRIFAVTVAIRWPVALFIGTLRGFQKQLRVNGISSAALSLKILGAIILVIFITPRLSALLGWFLLCGLIELLMFFYAVLAVTKIQAPNSLRELLGIVKRLWRFTGSVALIAIFAAAIKQADKLMVARLLPLEDLAYYNLASQAVLVTGVFVGPLMIALFPKFSALISAEKPRELAGLYHKSAALVAFVSAPIAAALVFYSQPILEVWTQSPNVAKGAAPVLSVFGLAAMLNAPMQLTYILTLAAGRPWIPLVNNLVGAIAFIPLAYWLIVKYGMIGGAGAWLAFNIAYVTLVPILVDRHVLHGSYWRWVIWDNGLFMLSAFVVFGCTHYCLGESAPVVWTFVTVLAAFVIYVVAVLIFRRDIMATLWELLRTLRSVAR